MSTDRAAQLVEAGIWLKLSGDREGARKLFERALKLDPANEKAAQLLAGGPAPGEAELFPPAPPAAPPTVPSSLGANPFERPAHSAPTQTEADWGIATGFRPPTPEPSLEGDWGRLTGGSTPVPGKSPVRPVASQKDDPGPYVSSSSNVVLGASPVPRTPKTTMQLFTPEKGPRPTLQLTPVQQPEPRGPRATMQLFTPFEGSPSAKPVQTAATIQIGGDPGPEAPPPSTPPLFGYGETQPAISVNVETGDSAAPRRPPRTGPSLFGSDSAVGARPSTPPLFASPPAEAPRTATDPMGYAWAWSNSSPPPKPTDPFTDSEAEPPPPPRPSPRLAPKAESAWDQRSNPGIKLEAFAEQNRALDMIAADSKITRALDSRKEEIRTILRGARDLLDLDDHSGAMELILKAQSIAPNDPDVLAMREHSEKTLLAMFESKLGKLETIPRVLLKDDEIIWLNLDHRAGFVLAQIDGTVSFDDLFSVSGMSRIDTARILAQLVEEGVISRG